MGMRLQNQCSPVLCVQTSNAQERRLADALADLELTESHARKSQGVFLLGQSPIGNSVKLALTTA